MRTFTLIKEYPKSPELGAKVVYDKDFHLYFNNKTGYEYSINQIENFPEFWKEVVEYNQYDMVTDGNYKESYIKIGNRWYEIKVTDYSDEDITAKNLFKIGISPSNDLK